MHPIIKFTRGENSKNSRLYFIYTIIYNEISLKVFMGDFIHFF